MKTFEAVLKATIEHQIIGEVHSVIIHDTKTGKHIRYPVTTRSDAEYVTGFFRQVISNFISQVSEAQASDQTADQDGASPTIIAPADLAKTAKPYDSLADASHEKDDEDDSESSGVAQLG